jgi:hypothetical protein
VNDVDEKQVFLAGYAAAMLEYSIMRDGERFIGVMAHPLKPELAKLSEDSRVNKFFATAKRLNYPPLYPPRQNQDE